MNPCSYHGYETCICNPYYTGYYDGKRDCRNMATSKPEEKSVELMVMATPSNFRLTLKQSAMDRLITAFKSGSGVVDLEGKNGKRYIIRVNTISSIYTL